jgi:hypothetical protein
MDLGISKGVFTGTDLGVFEGNEANYEVGMSDGIFNQNALNPKIIQNGLILYVDAADYRSYPRTGRIWRDLIGKRAGNMIGETTFNSNNGGSINFGDVSGGLVNFGRIDNGTDFTLAGWFIHPSSSFVQFNNLISKDNNSIERVYQISLNFDNLQCHLPANSPFNGGTITPNIWYYYTFTSSSANGRRLYLDASLNGTGAGAIQASTNAVDVTLHTFFNLDPKASNIRIATTQIYNRELSATEIRQNYNAQRIRYNR